MKITIKKDDDYVVIDEEMQESTIRYSYDRIMEVVESVIESLTKERNG